MPGDSKGAGAASERFDTPDWFFDNGLDIFVVLKDWGIERINPAWTEITGWSIEESLGRGLEFFGHADDMSVIRAASKRMMEGRATEAEFRVRTKDGRWLTVSSRMRMNDDGRVMSVLRDVTEERLRAIEAERAAKSFELLRAAARVYLWSFNPDTGSYTTEVESQPGSSEFGAQNVSGAQMSDNIHPDDREAFGKAFLPAIRTGETGQFFYRYVNPHGEGWVVYRTEWRGVRQCESGKWEIRGLTQDVTELAEARDAAVRGEAAAKEAAETKGQFLANMSHEIRTPLNGVLGVLHLLKTEALSDEGRSLLAEAVNCGGMLTELLNDVLDFSKIEAGRLELESQAVEVEAVIDGVAALLRPQIEAKGLYLKTEVEPGVGWVRSDPVRLRQVLFNLIGNAAKFTARGGVTLKLSTLGGGDQRRLRFQVIDTGIGIAPEAQERLFTRFHQADGSTTRRFGGTGLGLAITKALVELMQGEAGVESVEGEGSTFWIETPAPEIAAPAAAVDEDAPWLDGLRVLVVEDNATNRLIATKMLENLGASVETAENGALGLDAARRGAFDLIFMDVQMPVMDGVAATRAIRKLPAPVGQTPIVAMTANAMAHQVREYLAAGMSGAVSKPLSPAAIIAEIARLAGDGGEAEGEAAVA